MESRTFKKIRWSAQPVFTLQSDITKFRFSKSRVKTIDASELKRNFVSPPDSSRLWCFWVPMRFITSRSEVIPREQTKKLKINDFASTKEKVKADGNVNFRFERLLHPWDCVLLSEKLS